MTAFLDHYEDTESDFTFDRASTKTSRTWKNHESNDAFSADLNEEYRKQSQTSDDNVAFLCDRNRCFTGIAIGLPLSIVFWAGIFSLLYLITR